MASTPELMVLSGADVGALLGGHRGRVLEVIERAYVAHVNGLASPPCSSFLRLPARDGDRIIALPAYLLGPWQVAGLKWIASVPANLKRGSDRASAVLILNDLETGNPIAVLEGSIISAWRTAASAALAARLIHNDAPHSVGVIGCGLIAYETLQFLQQVFPPASRVVAYDITRTASDFFVRRVRTQITSIRELTIAASAEDVLRDCDIIVLATTAVTPHINRIPPSDRTRTFLHLSLRDFSPDCLLEADNTADDILHVNQAQTSIHLLSEKLGHTAFMRGSLGEMLTSMIPARLADKGVSIFHPFGLGVLDLALGAFVKDLASNRGKTTFIPDFIPPPWRNEE